MLNKVGKNGDFVSDKESVIYRVGHKLKGE